MIEKLLHVLETIPDYPFWFRIALYSWVGASIVLAAMAYAFYPTPGLRVIDGFADIARREFDFRLRNRTGHAVDIVSADLTFFRGDERELGGLQNAQEVTGRYRLYVGPDGKPIAMLEGQDTLLPASIYFPFAGAQMAHVTLHMVDAIAAAEGARVRIAINAPELWERQYPRVKVVFHYDVEKETEPFVCELE